MTSATVRTGSGSAHEVRRTHARPCQQGLICAVFDASRLAVEPLSHLVPDLDGNRAEYAVASTLLEEAWVSAR